MAPRTTNRSKQAGTEVLKTPPRSLGPRARANSLGEPANVKKPAAKRQSNRLCQQAHDKRITRKTATGTKRSTRKAAAEPQDDLPALGTEQQYEKPRTRARTGNVDNASVSTDDMGPAEVHNPEQEAQDEVQVLSQVDAVQDLIFEGNDGQLRAILQVHNDQEKFRRLRLGYRVRLELDHLVDGNQTTDHVGYIHSWRVQKATARFRNASSNEWITSLLKSRCGKLPAELGEIAYCLQALYNNKGEPKAKMKKLGHADELIDNSIIFIEMVHIYPRFQRKGLGALALQSYHRLLATLPEWFAFAGTMLLVPARPEHDQGDSWGEMKDEDVVARLRTMYGKSGYQDWGAFEVGDVVIDVMALTIPPSEDDDGIAGAA